MIKKAQKVSHTGNFLYFCDSNSHFMKKKTVNREENILGTHIREARKAAKLSQEELGKKIGLGKSSISKIENGSTHISFADAAILMEIMGAKMNIVLETEEQTRKKQADIMRFTRTCVTWFSEFKQIPFSEAFHIMMNCKALTFLKENYTYESTMPRDVIMEDIDRFIYRHKLIVE